MTVAWIDGLERLEAYWACADQTFAPPFKAGMPDLLIIHSAETRNCPAEYLHNPIAEKPKPGQAPKGRLCPDGKRRMVAAAHLCYYDDYWKMVPLRKGCTKPSQGGQFVQCAPLDRECPGAGGSVFQGLRTANRRAIHLELPAALNVRDQFEALLDKLLVAAPTLRFYSTHKEGDPHNKRDPVPGTGWTKDWMGKSRLIWAPRGI